MFYNNRIVKQKVNAYFAGKVSKSELNLWAKEAFEDLLRGGFVYIEKLYTYFFLKKLSIFIPVSNNIKDEYLCTPSEVIEIQSILSGSTNKVYKLSVKLNRALFNSQGIEIFCAEKEKQYQHLKEIILNLTNGGSLSDMDKIYIKDIQSKQLVQPKTLFELLESYILALLSDPDVDLLDLPYAHESGLYLGGNADKCDLYLKLLMFTDYYLGYETFRACISFFEGKPSIVII